jgi:hypothetical protein
MIFYLLGHVFLTIINIVNSRVDAYRILKNKTIAHGLNFGVYALFTGVLCWLSHWNVWVIAIFCASAFCNRQISFDIPLNKRRGLKWDYVSTAKPPKAIMDRIEIRVFGYNGRAPILVYGIGWAICLVIKVILE